MEKPGTIAPIDRAKAYLYSTKNWVDIYKLITNTNIEVEVRYRDVKLLKDTLPKAFTVLNSLNIANNRITVAAYQRLVNYYKNDNDFTYTNTVDIVKKYNDNIRSISTSTNTIYQKKVELKGWPEFSASGFAIAISQETELTNVNINNLILKPYSERQRSRQSFTYIINNKPIYKIDLTEVRINIDLKSIIPDQPNYSKLLPAVMIYDNYLIYYSLEIEYLANQQGNNNGNYWESFRLAAKKLLVLLQNSSIIYNIEDKYAVLNQCNRLLWSIFVNDNSKYEDRDQITASLLTQPRNLRMNEITWGQLFGHSELERTFYVTPKADGERRLLFITKTAIWLLAPLDRVSKVVSTDSSNLPSGLLDLLNRYDGAIFDGELVPYQNWRQPMGTPELLPPGNKTINWFLLFDCICLGYNQKAKVGLAAKSNQ